MHRSVPLCIRSLSIIDFGIRGGSWNQSAADTEGQRSLGGGLGAAQSYTQMFDCVWGGGRGCLL